MSDNNAEYWARRYKKMEDAIKDRSFDYVKNLEKQFDAAIAQLDTEIRAWYQRIAVNNEISYSDAQKLLNKDELEEFHWTVEEYIRRGKENGISADWSKELENASARVHISRLESIKLRLQQKAEELSAGEIKAAENAARFAYTESYHQTAFELQKGLGYGWTMQAIDERRIEKVLSRPWTADNKTFTARCWTDKNKLLDVVSRELTRMIATGEAPDRAIDAIAHQFKVSKNNAGRLVMTESAYFASAAQKDCFNDLGVERYSVVATLDKSTCSICGDMDGKVFPMSKFEVGITAPPFHPWCRCCTAPYYEDMKGIGERFARDPETGKTYTVPKDMTYKEWKAKYVDNSTKSGIINTIETKQDYAEAGLMFISKRDSLYRFAQKVQPYRNYTDITFHADRNHFLILDPITGDVVQEMSTSEVAKLLKNSDNYNGTPIRLLSCQAGYGGPDSLAQQLADELGVNVIAPTEILAIDSSGRMFVSDNQVLIDLWASGINVKETGEWIKFKPRR